ncbi:MAG: DUF192 domain-containing protein [Acetivibrionales bacterium]|jgi:uncharacterized membrane protein (UPF0127 family)
MILLGDYVKSSNILHYLTQTGKDIPVRIAKTFSSRFWGLIGKKEADYGLLLYPCKSLHTFFMRYNLDILFLDDDNRIVAIKRFVKPFSVVPPVREAVKVLEFPSSLHASAFMNVGDKITLYKNLE